jgi:hypothetical protein
LNQFHRIGVWKRRKTKKGHFLVIRNALWCCNQTLDNGYIDGRRTFLALLDIKGNTIAFIKRPETGCIDRGVMDKYVRSVFLLDEAEAFAGVKPFYDSIGHALTLLSKKISKFYTGGYGIQKRIGPSE